MGKDKSAFWNAQCEPDSAQSCGAPLGKTHVDESSVGGQRSARWILVVAGAVVVASLVVAGPVPAFADKGGRSPRAGVPDVDLGLSRIQNMGQGAGPFVPSGSINVAPGLMRGPATGHGISGADAPGASALTPANGLTPPGHLDTPGLGLGRSTSTGLSPATAPSVPGGQGLGLGRGKGPDRDGPGSLSNPNPSNAAAARLAADPEPSQQDASQNDGSLKRPIPICR